MDEAIRLTHMSKASLADDEPRDGEAQDMTSRIYGIIRDYGEAFPCVLRTRGAVVMMIVRCTPFVFLLGVGELK